MLKINCFSCSFPAYFKYCLIEAVERFKERTGYYPECVLADQIYRTRENRSYCKEHGIRLSGPKLGRPSVTAKVDKKQEYQDNTDRIEVERRFSLSKRCYGMSCITTIGVTGADVKVGSCKYLLNQQTLSKYD